ncbi:MAG: amidohydrolase [Clostridia bacterium]|nr:amidohydrolase [Clostridia bacterium]
MEIFDFHTHIYPAKISQKAVKSVSDFYTLEMDGDGTSENLLSQGSRYGVSGYLVNSVAVDASHVETINNYIASECVKHKEFYGFGTMHAAYANKIDELERMVSMGLRGVKIHPDTQRYNMDDRRMDEVYDYLSQTGLPILIHCGDYRYTCSHPKRLATVLDKFPKLTVIGAHFGGWSLWDLALEYLKDRNCYMDTSSSFSMLGLVRSKELIRIYGAERILFGTDFPMWNLKEELDNMEKLQLTNEEYELIFHKNAEKILKI